MSNFARYFEEISTMACILHIETSTDVCSVAVSRDGLCVFEREDHEGPNHAVKSGVFIDEALSYIDSQLLTLDAVAVSCGPGSYTGLRIGVSTAKGICYGRNAQLISIPTLELLCVPVLLREKVQEDDALLCPMLDARRMEVYAALFDRSMARPIARSSTSDPSISSATVPRSAWRSSTIRTPTSSRVSSPWHDGCFHWPNSGFSPKSSRMWPISCPST